MPTALPETKTMTLPAVAPENEKKSPTRLLVRVTADTHRRLKNESERTGQSIREIVEEAVHLRESRRARSKAA